jgi:hypothetical protein
MVNFTFTFIQGFGETREKYGLKDPGIRIRKTCLTAAEWEIMSQPHLAQDSNVN